ncbi:hypothetical protein TNCV_4196421 [Trichonephila clavipes]|nr:hypothetical protein TNCV_4196421 [Trichonephila clavipes]
MPIQFLWISQILYTPVMANKVQDMVRESDHTFLNLVVLDWKSQLDNYLCYQLFLKEAKMCFQTRVRLNIRFRVQNLKDSEKSLKVIVAGVCNVYRPFTKLQPGYHFQLP